MRTLFAFLLLSSVAFAQDLGIDPEVLEIEQRLEEDRHEAELFQKQMELEELRSRIVLDKMEQAEPLKAMSAVPAKTLRVNINGNWLEFPFEVIDGTEPPADRDGDGIPDDQDECPDDPENKCNDPPPVDSDGDGTPDETDPCPNDPEDKCNDPPPADTDVYAEQRARIRQMHAEGHPWITYIISHANTWKHQSETVQSAWLATGEQQYGQWLFQKNFPELPPTVGGNMLKQAPDWCLAFWDLRRAGVLTAEQLALGEQRLKYIADEIVAHTTRLGDSDHVVFALAHLAMTDAILDTNYMSHPYVGGWEYDPTQGPKDTMRNAFHWYCTDLGEGGAFPEGGAYNNLTLWGAGTFIDFVERLRGKNDFPEFTAFAADAAVLNEMEVFPDYKGVRSWGDTQDPWHLRLIYGYGKHAVLGNDRAVQKIYNANGVGSLKYPWRGWYNINLYSNAGPELPFTKFAAGQGILISRNDTTQFFTRFAPDSEHTVDHYHRNNSGNWTMWHRGDIAVGYQVAYGPVLNLNEVVFNGTDSLSTRHENIAYGDGSTWSGIVGGTYGHPTNEYGTDYASTTIPTLVPDRTRSQVFIAGDNPIVVIRDKFTVNDFRSMDMSKISAYHRWLYQNWKPITFPAANQIVVPVSPTSGSWHTNPTNYWMFWGEKNLQAENPAKARVQAVAPWPDDPTKSLVTFDNSAGSPTMENVIGFLGKGTFTQMMVAEEAARHQIYVRPGAELQSNGVCTFPVADYQVTISHHGTPAEYRLVDSGTTFGTAAEKAKFPQRYEQFIPFAEGATSYSADWFTVIQTANPPLPVSLQGSVITVGDKTITFGTSDAIGVH